MNIENLSQAELWDLHAKICAKLGFHILEGVAVEDVKKGLEERLDDGELFTMPSDEEIRQALRQYAKRYQSYFSEMVYDIGAALVKETPVLSAEGV